jgi:glycerol-3-phosphate dehydrogenase (NAD(P)+)
MAEKIAIIGDGGWGTGLAIHLDKLGHKVTIWGKFHDYTESMKSSRENTRFLPGIKIPDSINLISNFDAYLGGFSLYIIAIPCQYMRNTLSEIKTLFDAKTPVLSVSKGIEIGTLKRPSEIIKEIIGNVKIGVLSGPSFAIEVAKGLPTAVVIASHDQTLSAYLQKILSSETFRVYTSSDTIGIELGGALKNVIAIACGICEGLGYGDNAKSALLVRGIVEIARLGREIGAKEETFWGLSGIGDLVLSSYGNYGRNLTVGRKIGKGAKLDEILAGMQQVAEGIWTTKSTIALANKSKIDMPITREIYKVLFEGKDPRLAVRDLMNRPPVPEKRN